MKRFFLFIPLSLCAYTICGQGSSATTTVDSKSEEIVKTINFGKNTRFLPSSGTVHQATISYRTRINNTSPENPTQNSTQAPEIQINLNTDAIKQELHKYQQGAKRGLALNSQEAGIQDLYKHISEHILWLQETKTLTVLSASCNLITAEQKIQATLRLIKKGNQIRAEISLEGHQSSVQPEIINLIKSILLDGPLQCIPNFFYKTYKGAIGTLVTLASLGILSKRMSPDRHPPIKITPVIPTTKFKDVAGAYSAKEALQEILDYLKNPATFCATGARPPRGVLFYGEPGNGKTLLAKALAGESNRNFLHSNGAEFVQIFVGSGPKRVRELFAQAREQTPCIVFIDEIDAIGGDRSKPGLPNQERDATLNQLLTEMDGFATNPGDVIVIGATNMLETLDPALTRAGRFDHKIEVRAPSSNEERQEVLQVHIEGNIVCTHKNVNVFDIAAKTKGFSCADLEAVVNQAIRIAAKRPLDHKPLRGVTIPNSVQIQDFDAAIDNIRMGPYQEKATRRLLADSNRNKRIATRLAGQAALNILLQSPTPLDRITLKVHKEAGALLTIPRERHDEERESELHNQITELLGGIAAQKLLLDEPDTSTAPNRHKARHIARKIVAHFHPYDTTEEQIIEECLDKATQLLTANQNKLEALIAELIKKTTLYASDVKRIMEETAT